VSRDELQFSALTQNIKNETQHQVRRFFQGNAEKADSPLDKVGNLTYNLVSVFVGDKTNSYLN